MIAKRTSCDYAEALAQGEGLFSETFTDAAMCRGVREEVVGQRRLGVVAFAVEVAAGEAVLAEPGGPIRQLAIGTCTYPVCPSSVDWWPRSAEWARMPIETVPAVPVVATVSNPSAVR